jgi:hypothetical protein
LDFVFVPDLDVSNTETSKIRKDTAVEACADFCRGYLGVEPPHISSKLANAMGLHGIPNLRIQRTVDSELEREPHQSRVSLIKKYKSDILKRVRSIK